MYGYIYKTTNLVNGKIYIGKKESSEYVSTYFGSGKLIKRAIEKYGVDNFKNEVLFWCKNLEELNSKEVETIKDNDSFYYSGHGYNIAGGGDGGDLISNMSETDRVVYLQKKSEQNTGKNNPNYGNHMSIKGNRNPTKRPEVRQKLSQSLLGSKNPMYGKRGSNYGKHLSLETRQKLSKALSGENNPNYGIPKSEETKRKISEAQKGRSFTEEHKRNLRKPHKMSDSWREHMKNRVFNIKCVICSTEFQSGASNAKYCKECNPKNKKSVNQNMSKGCKARMYKNKCVDCGNTFDAKSNRTKRCNECKKIPS